MKKVFLTIFILFNIELFACSCTYGGNFLQLANRTDLIALVKVKAFPNYDSSSNRMPTQMEVEIIETLKGQSESTRIIVYGQDGINCLEWLNKFKIGNSYVLSLYSNKSNSALKGNLQLFDLSTCGDYWLSFNNREVKGVISNKRTKAFATKLRKLNDKIGKAIDDDNEKKERKLKAAKQALYDSLQESMSYNLLKEKLREQTQRSS